MWRDIVEKAAVSLGTLVVVWAWKELAPRFAQLFYSEPLIAGIWRTTFAEEGTEFHENVKLVQRGRKVEGEIILEDGGVQTKYKFKGIFRYLILTGTYEATDPRDYEQGAFALKYVSGRLVGEHILLSRTSDQPITSRYLWEPVKS